MLSKILFFNDEMSKHSIPLLVASNKKMTPLRWIPMQLFVCSQRYLCTWYPLRASDHDATRNHGYGRYFFWLTDLLNRHFIKWATEQSFWLFFLLFLSSALSGPLSGRILPMPHSQITEKKLERSSLMTPDQLVFSMLLERRYGNMTSGLTFKCSNMVKWTQETYSIDSIR